MQEKIYFSVRGAWPFPLDMLRKGEAHPATPEDQRKIERLSAEHAYCFDDIQCPVTIELFGRRPTTERWESFGWKVPSDVLHHDEQLRKAARLRQEALIASALNKLTPEEREAVEARMLL